MHESAYIIELAATHFGVKAKDMCTKKNIINVSSAKKTAYILLRKYCALEPYRIGFIFNSVGSTVQHDICVSKRNVVICNAVKEIENKYLIIKQPSSSSL